MKKKIIIAIAIAIAVILLFPIPLRLKDGGTVKYQAILYSISDVHRLAPTDNDVGYEDGIIIEIFGIEVFNNVTPAINEDDRAEEYDLTPMVKIDGVLYLDTGFRRSETWSHTDGQITSQVAGSQTPTENDQSNFGTGYAYRFGDVDGTVYVLVDTQWLVFATEEVRHNLQLGVTPSNPVYDVEFSYATNPKTNKIFLNTLNREMLPQANPRHLAIYKFDSLDDLNQFKADYADEFNFDSSYDEVPSFNEVTAKYTEKFFKDTTLFLVYIDSPNSTHRFGMNSISWDKKSFCIYVEETTGAESTDSALAGWFLTVAVSSESVASCTEFDAVMDKIDLTLPTAPVLRESPSLVVTTHGSIIEALKGTSSWIYVDDNGDAAAIMGDSNHPLLKKASTPILDLIPTYFSSGDPLGVTFQFGTAPNEITPDKVTVRCWPEECWGDTNAESEELPVTIENGYVFTQLKDGNYIYEVIAEWESGKRSVSGTVCYSFCTAKPSLEIEGTNP